ncbi:uncharacterized protein LOC131429392 [Malaya genurostris]|uniref:uncharacterized protein LOC131429392 n=1 Tax=Malaya genurostris TaxID=325434 RepID=UPI0026F403AF|nr:uncharacterized protein LOC131429392 [Malaya genurostris]
MFRQVWVHPEDRKFQQIIWRQNPTEPLKCFQLKTVTYGLASSPYHAARVLNKLAEDEGARFHRAAQIVTNRMYVDDVLAGGDELEEVAEVCSELSSLLARGGLSLRKWCANDLRILKQVPQELWEATTELEIGHMEGMKTLGLLWHPQTDRLAFKIPSLPAINIVTKRIVVSEMSSLFDPLGLVGPVVVSAKIFVQRLWIKNLGWDENVTEEDRIWWLGFRNELSQLQQLTVSRRILANTNRDYTLHCFCDASTKGYGCCIYVTGPDLEGQLKSQLLISKSRVAPVRPMTVPRLELCAALLGSQLMETVRTTTEFTGPAMFWTDSTIVLHWIRSPPTIWKVFVSNRIAEVQRLTKGLAWRHVPTDQNPADHVSRGLRPGQMLNDALWWHASPFLDNSIDLSPTVPPSLSAAAHCVLDAERREIVALTSVQLNEDLFNRYSELGRLLRITAWCTRFYTNCRFVKQRILGRLLPKEIEEAMKRLVRICQQNAFSNEMHQFELNKTQPNHTIVLGKNSSLKHLNLMLDKHGLLRLDGRLKNINGSYDRKCPMILPAQHRFSELIARSLHLQTAHCGPSLLLATMRQRFWPLRAQQQMAPLPAVRVTPARVFSRSGLDYCGPFNVRPLVGRGANAKVYVAVFVCLAVKAVHFEIVPNLTSGACINAIKRFVSRRGRVTELHCDNGTAFVGADRELQDLLKQYLQQFQTDEWENYYELMTAAAHIESILNSRPLTPLTDHSDDLAVLTPGHFLIGEPMFSIPEPDCTELKITRLSRFQEMCRSLQHFWKCWSRDYISQLHQRAKWKKPCNNVQLGALVLLKQDNLPPYLWNIGRIVKTYTGDSGLVRVVLVRTARGLYKRAVTEVRILPIDTVDHSHDGITADHQNLQSEVASTEANDDLITGAERQ